MRHQEPKVGDFVLTNEFFSISENGKDVVKEGLPAVIVQEENDKFLCRFGKGHSWTKNYKNLFSDKYGYYLSEHEFEIDND